MLLVGIVFSRSDKRNSHRSRSIERKPSEKNSIIGVDDTYNEKCEVGFSSCLVNGRSDGQESGVFTLNGCVCACDGLRVELLKESERHTQTYRQTEREREKQWAPIKLTNVCSLVLVLVRLLLHTLTFSSPLC